MEINFETVAGFVKILAIVIALFHLLAGLFITRQITSSASLNNIDTGLRNFQNSIY
jgi:hypothetical protein